MRTEPKTFEALTGPLDYATRWGAPLLETIPVPGHATVRDWAGLSDVSKRWPGRNHPRAGAWLTSRYAPAGGVLADPFIGIGGLWLGAPKHAVIHGCELEAAGAEAARRNLIEFRGRIDQGDARTWRPPHGHHTVLTLFSPPFRQNHSAGKTAHQQDLRDAKKLHSMQAFGAAPGNIGTLKPGEFWRAMAQTYAQVRSYTDGVAVVILRNRISQGLELDEVGDHLNLLREARFEVLGVHPRDLVRPTAYQAWKVARDPRTPWVRWEWAVVAR